MKWKKQERDFFSHRRNVEPVLGFRKVGIYDWVNLLHQSDLTGFCVFLKNLLGFQWVSCTLGFHSIFHAVFGQYKSICPRKNEQPRFQDHKNDVLVKLFDLHAHWMLRQYRFPTWEGSISPQTLAVPPFLQMWTHGRNMPEKKAWISRFTNYHPVLLPMQFQKMRNPVSFGTGLPVSSLNRQSWKIANNHV